MGFRIHTNINAMNAYHHATANNVGLDKSLTALSSGLRINKTADDLAGYAISSKLSAQSRGLGQAINNANDAVGLTQIADAAMQEYSSKIKQIRTLFIKAANDTQDSDSKLFIAKELVELEKGIDNIANNTTYNGMKLFASTKTYTFQTGAYSSDTTKMTIDKMDHLSVFDGNALGSDAAAIVTNILDNSANLSTWMQRMDTSLNKVDTLRSTLGATQNQLEFTVRNISLGQINIAAAESNIRDVDFAFESSNFVKHNVLARSGSYALSQSNIVQQNVVRLLKYSFSLIAINLLISKVSEMFKF